MFGIPYAQKVLEGRKMFAVCPVCGERVHLKKKKDFESFSGIEYAAHYEAKHSAQPAAG